MPKNKMFILINDKTTNEFLKYKNGEIIKYETIQDCLEYLWYVLGLEDISNYEFVDKIIQVEY